MSDSTAGPTTVLVRQGRPKRRTRRARRSSTLLTVVLLAALVYFLLPLWWMVIASTKDGQQLNGTFGLWFASSPRIGENLRDVFVAHDGVYLQWVANTVLYAAVAAIGAAVSATMAGYALAKFEFRGRAAVLASILLAVAVPVTVIVLPLFLILSAARLTNTPWAVILPSMVNPFGVYIVWIFAQDALPTELLEAARIDGASEWRVLTRITFPLLRPALITVALFSFVSTWNNYFLPRLVLSDDRLYPLSVGLAQWNSEASIGAAAGGFATYQMVITGSLVAVTPLVAAFLFMQRYWQNGLTLGSVKG